MKLVPILSALMLTLSAQHSPAQPADAKRLKDVLTGDARGAAADNPQCRLFTPADVSRYVGVPLLAGSNAGMGLGCQWVSAKDDADVMISVVPARYHEAPRLAKGYRPVSDVGAKGFVAPEMGGWVAGAIVGEEALRVSVTGPKASDANAIALLQEAIARRKR